MKPALLAVGVAVALLLPGASSRGTPTVGITIHHSHFFPSHLSFPSGTTVRFVIRNTDPIDHEFIVGPMAMQLMHEYATDALHSGSAGAVSVPLFSTRSTTYEFSGSDAMLFGCHLPGHWAYGMRGTIAVVRR